MKPTYRKSWAGNLLIGSDVALGSRTMDHWLWRVVFPVDTNLHRFSDALGVVSRYLPIIYPWQTNTFFVYT